uniref:Uncharacterized protein n=1 Tax=Arundo donax TaxID=35708 RepID=A0A0A8Y9C3_ARUDO
MSSPKISSPCLALVGLTTPPRPQRRHHWPAPLLATKIPPPVRHPPSPCFTQLHLMGSPSSSVLPTARPPSATY